MLIAIVPNLSNNYNSTCVGLIYEYKKPWNIFVIRIVAVQLVAHDSQF